MKMKNKDMEKKTKINYVYQKKILKTQTIYGVAPGEVYETRDHLSKQHNIPIGEIRVEWEDEK